MKKFYPVIESVKSGDHYHFQSQTVRSGSKKLANEAFAIEYSKAKNKKFNFIRAIEV